MNACNRQFLPKKLVILVGNWSVVVGNFFKHFSFIVIFLLFINFILFFDYFKPWTIQLNMKVVCPMLLKRRRVWCYQTFFYFLFKLGLG
jgi:hypothetical protein